VTIDTAAWLGTFSSEYLDEFLRDGGATVKFLVGDTDERCAAVEGLRERGEARGYLVTRVDGSATKLHLVEQLFFAVARQVDWFALADAVRDRVARESGYSALGESLTFAGIAQATGIAPHVIRNVIQRALSEQVFSDYGMTQEFRLAMMHLCLEPMSNPHEGAGGMSDLVVDWLRGDLRLVSALKPALIYQKIARHNARDTFVSLCHWARMAGHAGLIVTIDMSAYLVRTRADVAEGGSYYTRAATMDLYEALRQFVDSMDELDGAAIVVLAAREFLSDDARGLRMYRALEARVAEEVRDRVHDNPVAGLIRLGPVA
jgi:hypothetical protein